MIRTRKGPLVYIDKCPQCPFLRLEEEAKQWTCHAPVYLHRRVPVVLGPLSASGEADPPKACEMRSTPVAVLVGPYEEEKRGSRASR